MHQTGSWVQIHFAGGNSLVTTDLILEKSRKFIISSLPSSIVKTKRIQVPPASVFVYYPLHTVPLTSIHIQSRRQFKSYSLPRISFALHAVFSLTSRICFWGCWLLKSKMYNQTSDSNINQVVTNRVLGCVEVTILKPFIESNINCFFSVFKTYYFSGIGS
jgi:hypothetical protein